ncbi:MAG TPA: 5'-methylthioadenosine/S-adenosylhomocysteine nucleosidase [Kofleriaceae bacterium]|jgi:adenosylhomocysteine nucleosidase|nr:5'-methylthioadenosine/S-adenosylhomocysteine nucleosidase [Kofleriaceae bacterium]
MVTVVLGLVLGLALAACAHTAPGPSAPGTGRARVVAMISANAEWKVLRAQLPEAPVNDTPFGEWLVHRLGGEDVVFFHGGWGKVAAAGSTQYAIDRWHPALLVNLGTCGGFGGARKVGDIVLASETTIYDIVEMMGDANEAIADYHTPLDTSAWPARLASRVVVAPIVSADRDLDPAAVAGLAAKYHTGAGDWESGAIAWVGARNHTRVLILRGVTDVVDAQGNDPTYNAEAVWERASIAVMTALVGLLGDALPDLVASR